MGQKKYPMTVVGTENLKKELERLSGPERLRVRAAIAEARAHGDLSENAEYHAAREEQGLMEARIRDIEGKLSFAQIIDVSSMVLSLSVYVSQSVSLCVSVS